MKSSVQQFLSNALRRRFRLRIGLAAACWLLLNMQLALAAHAHPSVSPSQVSVEASQHQAGPHDNTPPQAPGEPVCDKHCHPDRAPSVWQTLHPDALPNEFTFLLVIQSDEVACPDNSWRMPQITGPPAEIRFCRFRE